LRRVQDFNLPFLFSVFLVEFVPEKDINGLAALTAARISFNMIGALVRSAFFAQNRI
jgi:hypothetical protein